MGEWTIFPKWPRVKVQNVGRNVPGLLSPSSVAFSPSPMSAHADQRDEGLQDFVGPFADSVDPRVAHHPLIGLVAEIALAAEDLERLVDALPEGLGREDLEDRGLEHVVFGAPIDQGGRLVGRGFHRVGRGGEIGDLLLDQLEVGEGPAELTTLRRVARRGGEADLGQSRATGTEGRPAEVEDRQRDLEPLAQRAEDIAKPARACRGRRAGPWRCPGCRTWASSPRRPRNRACRA